MESELITNQLQKFNLTDSKLAEIKQNYMPLVINGLDDKEGYKAVYNARQDVKSKRVAIEKTRKDLKADLLDSGRRIDSEAKRITTVLESVEHHLYAQERAVDAEKERIKKEEQDAENARIQLRIDALHAVQARVNHVTLPKLSDEDFELLLVDETIRFNEQQAEQKRKEEELKRQLAEQKEAARIAKEEESKKAAEMAANLESIRKSAEEKTRVDESEKKALKEKIYELEKKSEADARMEGMNQSDTDKPIVTQNRLHEQDDSGPNSLVDAEFEEVEPAEGDILTIDNLLDALEKRLDRFSKNTYSQYDKGLYGGIYISLTLTKELKSNNNNENKNAKL